MKILFICGGNVARSQMAEAMVNNLAGGKHVASSAGTKVTKEQVGQKIKDKDPNIVAVMQEIGIDVADYERKMLTPEAFGAADKVVVMLPSANIPDYFHNDAKVIFWDVPDPFKQDLEFARRVRDIIKAKVRELISVLDSKL
ncbi:MAG: hypothetical protein HYY10_02090 [Candidatus Liptonbacteria bacterium]|nr:hypothetical protein [Candidatus Liptonbacteria bacterium]